MPERSTHQRQQHLQAPAPETPAEPPKKQSWFQRLKAGLAKTSSRLTDGIAGLVTKRKLDGATLEELEDLLIGADLGLDTASRITAAIAKGRFEKGITDEDVRGILSTEITKVLEPVAHLSSSTQRRSRTSSSCSASTAAARQRPSASLQAQLTHEGKKVMLGAGDTFRAAAIEQLKVWGERTGAPVMARDVGSDASGLAYDALKAAQDGAYDVLLLDTAGRLQNKEGLMAELEKIVRVLKKLDPTAPHDVVARARCHYGPERPQSGRGVPRARRRHGPYHDQARRHGARRHSRRHCRQVRLFRCTPLAWAKHRRPAAIQSRRFRPSHR